MTPKTPQIVGPDGHTPVRSLAALEASGGIPRELMNALKAVQQRGLQNSLEGLVSGIAGNTGYMRADNITSFNPLYTSSIYAPLTVNYTLLSYLYKTHGVMQTMIDEPVLDAFRDGLELTSKEVGEGSVGIACATRMPFSKLFGTTAGGSGLANSGEDDLENYNAMVTSRVRTPAKPIIRKMLRLMMIAVWGKEYDSSFEFKPLRVLSAKEEEEIKKSKQERYQSLYRDRLLDSKEIGELLHKEKLVPIQTKAQQGLLPANPEVPTTEQMFDQQGEGDDQGRGEGKGGGAVDDR